MGIYLELIVEISSRRFPRASEYHEKFSVNFGEVTFAMFVSTQNVFATSLPRPLLALPYEWISRLGMKCAAQSTYTWLVANVCQAALAVWSRAWRRKKGCFVHPRARARELWCSTQYFECYEVSTVMVDNVLKCDHTANVWGVPFGCRLTILRTRWR